MCAHKLVIVRGGGDLATGIIYRLWQAGFAVLCLETGRPLVVRRAVAVASAVFDGSVVIEGMRAVRLSSLSEFHGGTDEISVLVDPRGEAIRALQPFAVVDAIMAKRNTGTCRSMAPLVVAIGPGFSAPAEVDAVVETQRGPDLGRVITNGSAAPNTGIPGLICGCSTERLLRAPAAGLVLPRKEIGGEVAAGEIVATVSGVPVAAQINGVLRGLIHRSVPVEKGCKIGDVDPRCIKAYCYTISDKALAVGGGVLEVLAGPALRHGADHS